MVKYFCDMCKSQLGENFAPIKLQVGNNMHEFCNDCWFSLTSLLEGTGIPIVLTPSFQPYQTFQQPVIGDWKDMLGGGFGQKLGQQDNPTITVTYNADASIKTVTNSSGLLANLNDVQLLSLLNRVAEPSSSFCLAPEGV